MRPDSGSESAMPTISSTEIAQGAVGLRIVAHYRLTRAHVRAAGRQARGEGSGKKRFINDTIRNDFHRKFLNKYVK